MKFLFKLKKKEFKLTAALVKNTLPVLLSFVTVNKINQLLGKKDLSTYNLSILEDWLLGKIINNAFFEFYGDDYSTEKYYQTLKIILSFSTWLTDAIDNPAKAINILFSSDNVQNLLQFNRYQEILYFNAENFEELLKILFLVNLLVQSEKKLTTNKIDQGLILIKKMGKSAKSAGYRITTFVENL